MRQNLVPGKFGSWKLSFRREVISASSNPTLVSDRLAGIDVATRLEDLDYSRVVFENQPEYVRKAVGGTDVDQRGLSSDVKLLHARAEKRG